MRTTHRYLWIGLVAVSVVAGAVQQWTHALPVKLTMYLGVEFLCLAGLVVGVRIHRPADTRPWRWLILSQVVYLGAEVVFYALADIFHRVNFPSVADVAYLAHYVFFFGALLLLVRRRSGGSHDLASAIDAAIVGIGTGLVGWLAWIGPTLDLPMPLLNRWLAAIYPVTDIALLAVSFRLMAGRGVRSASVWALNAALLSLFVADALLCWQVTRGTYVAHNIDDVFWLGKFVLLGVAALHPSMHALTDAGPTPVTRPGLRTTAMSLAVAVPPAALVWHHGDQSNEAAIGVASLAMFSLVVLRLHLATRNEAGARRLVEAQRSEVAEALELLREANRARLLLLDGVVTAGENARSWIAAELHDGPIQTLAAIGFGMDRVTRRLAEADIAGARVALDSQRQELTKVIVGLRQMMTDLRPPALDESGLEDALRDSIRHLSESNIECEAELRLNGMRLGKKTETVLYRVAQEALTNVRKHSLARHCSIKLWPSMSGVALEISDDGRGFEQGHQSAFLIEQHFGLSTMRERVEACGGSWHLATGPTGTTIRAVVPATARMVEEAVAS